jgi:uncharacterized protein YaiL (DUF2058 family)
MNSLRDQLLKVGLVTEQQAKQAAQQEQQRQFRNRPPKPKHPDAQRGGGRPGQGGGPRQGHNPNAGSNRGPHTGAIAANTPATQGAPVNARPPQQPTQSSATLAAQQAQAAKVARDQELNRKREEKAKRRARLAEIEQIIEQHRVPRLETEDYYSFIDGKKIRRMSVDPPRREQLTIGTLAIVRYKGHYAVVPKDTAERIRERDANMVVPMVHPPADTAAAVEDAYKDFVVPDDLMW